MSSEFWEAAARKDPLWAILSDPTKKGRRWEPKDFFETGRREISLLLYQLRQLGQEPFAGRALDFGCGVGRLSQALSSFFPEVVGVDISPTMIRLAQRLNAAPTRVRYVLNDAEDLQCFASGSFDFIYSDIVFQHLPPEATKAFLAEFVRLLKIGGIVVFQLPSHKRGPGEHPTISIAMPDAAYRATLTNITGMPPVMAVNQRTQVSLSIENVSDGPWDQTVVGPVRIGNHWLSVGGEMLIQDDGRQNLVNVVAPHRMIEASLGIQAPPDAGTYLCEFDLVHEGITWFADRGSPTVRYPVTVVRPGHEQDQGTSERLEGHQTLNGMPEPFDFDLNAYLPAISDLDIGEFPMYGIRRDMVLQLLTEHCAPAFYVETDERGGPEWQGFRYFAKRTS